MYAGKVIVEDIGFPKHIIDSLTKEDCFLAYNEDIYREYLPKRKTNSNKGTYGRVLVVAGSKNMAGACYLSAKAAQNSSISSFWRAKGEKKEKKS